MGNRMIRGGLCGARIHIRKSLAVGNQLMAKGFLLLLCAGCTEENREQILSELIHIAKTKYGVVPAFTVQFIFVSGILYWNYEVQTLIES